MPIIKATTTFPDHRVFGFTVTGQIRANLHNSSASYAPGAMYSWIVCATVDQLAHKLAQQWEQEISDAEFETIEQLEASNAEFEIDCDECLATGIDPGGLSEHEPEECRVCHGAKRMSIATAYAPRVAA